MSILLPTVNNERRQWKQRPQFRIPSHASFIPNHQLGQKSKIFLLRLPCNRCPHTPEVYVAQTGMPLAFSTAQARKPLPLPPTAHDESWPSVSRGACWLVQGHLASAPSWAVGAFTGR